MFPLNVIGLSPEFNTVLLETTAFNTSYRRHGLRSLVVAWGPENALRAAFLAHLLVCGLLFAFGVLCRFRIAYLVGWLIIVVCLLLEHWIARRRSLNWIQLAFFRLNALVSAIFLIVTLAEVVFQGGFRLR